MTTTDRVFAIFAKYWQPGQVKTRLAAKIGHDVAAALHRVFVATLLRRFQSFPAQRQVCYDPIERRGEFEQLAGVAWQLVPQCNGKLGDRIGHYFATAFKRPASQVVVIGSDSPNIPVDYVRQAFHALTECDVVLGPSSDGGYYLVGLAKLLPDLFKDIAWSTPFVWQQTVERLERLHVPFVQLEPWYDVDQWEDLERLWSDLRESRDVEQNDLVQAVREVVEK